MRLSNFVMAGVFVALCSSLGAAQKSICIGTVSGGDASMWNLQQPLFKAITTEAASRGEQVKAQLLMSNNDRSAKGEMSSLKCDFGLLTNTNREWPQPKGGGLKQESSSDDEKNPHPSSTAYMEFTLLDKNAKKIDKFKTQIEMKPGYTAKDVQPELQEIIQEVANWTLDGAAAK